MDLSYFADGELKIVPVLRGAYGISTIVKVYE